ncbi:sirohydrochlorin chelatase [Ammoniphilus sp. 3BR4]|uniref:sirohydrochlorin chelatase n=1 Tax=Ammoniphilus sp. 3BR4 TaxID=3158265 RepID=UPI00346765C0
MFVVTSGVLVISHGSRDQGWIDKIEQAVSDARLAIPVETVFLELVPGKTIEDGIRRLESQGLTQILAVPLFLTMGSTHLAEIQYALGLIPASPIPTDLCIIQSKAEIIWCAPLESHPYVQAILSERVKNLSQDPLQEGLLLIGHGSEIQGFHERWEALLTSLTESLQKQWAFSEIAYATFHPDNIQERAEKLAKKSRLIVLPFFLSEGYFTNLAIPSRLKGLEYRYRGEGLLPHPYISVWLADMVRLYLPQEKRIDDTQRLLYTLNQ